VKKEAPLIRLSLKDVMKLLDVQTIAGNPWQLERVCRWIDRLVEKRGHNYVWENRQTLLSQWEKQLKAKSEHCC